MKQINITEATLAEAMVQLDALEGLDTKQKDCLRLLTEEMYSMVNELLKADKLDYEIGIDNMKYSLRVSVNAFVNEDAREQFLSISKDGRNAANKGIKGMLGAVMEALLYGDSGMDIGWRYGMCSPIDKDSSLWAMSTYVSQVPADAVRSEWDGMEKPIIESFSDDVIIGVRHGRLEMTVIKDFAK